MKDRIKLIMEKENMTPAKFADRLQINRPVISHILNGRNNASLDVVTKILSEMSYINPEWLLNGTGNMYKEQSGNTPSSMTPDLFSQMEQDSPKIPDTFVKPKEMGFKPTENNYQSVENKHVETPKINDRKISQIIIYYDDNTFEIFGPNK